jgi:hypothetical protein
MKRKLVFYVKKLISNDLAPFHILKQCLIDCKIDLLPNDTKSLIIIYHLNGIKDKFDKYFPKDTIEYVWILNPFIYDAYHLPEELTTPAQEELLTLVSDISMKQRFKLSTLKEFWSTTGRSYTHLYIISMKKLLKFPTSYLCEKGFCTMLFLKNKYRAR